MSHTRAAAEKHLGVTLYNDLATAKRLASRGRVPGDTCQVWYHHASQAYMPLAHRAAQGTFEPVYHAIERGDLTLAWYRYPGYGWHGAGSSDPHSDFDDPSVEA